MTHDRGDNIIWIKINRIMFDIAAYSALCYGLNDCRPRENSLLFFVTVTISYIVRQHLDFKIINPKLQCILGIHAWFLIEERSTVTGMTPVPLYLRQQILELPHQHGRTTLSRDTQINSTR